MPDEKKTLEVGDRIYKIGGLLGASEDSITAVYTIIRVTKTQAITKSGAKFQRDCSGYIKEVGTSIWRTGVYQFETDELKEKRDIEISRRRVKHLVDNYLDKLTSESLNEIVHIFATYASEGKLKVKE